MCYRNTRVIVYLCGHETETEDYSYCEQWNYPNHVIVDHTFRSNQLRAYCNRRECIQYYQNRSADYQPYGLRYCGTCGQRPAMTESYNCNVCAAQPNVDRRWRGGNANAICSVPRCGANIDSLGYDRCDACIIRHCDNVCIHNQCLEDGCSDGGRSDRSGYCSDHYNQHHCAEPGCRRHNLEGCYFCADHAYQARSSDEYSNNSSNRHCSIYNDYCVIHGTYH